MLPPWHVVLLLLAAAAALLLLLLLLLLALAPPIPADETVFYLLRAISTRVQFQKRT
eukprot:COSAG01_NODE_8891_length_2625_cov_1.409343_3_plen_57_part_00